MCSLIWCCLIEKGHKEILIAYISISIFPLLELGDFDHFNVPGKVSVHTSPPRPDFYGAVHFDDDEPWAEDAVGKS